ncbi:Transcriptional factor B3 family protein [Euphorbia peplus]|nr:Transcriptional factor B3 family protein [Euphorbia peplus]
MTPSWLNSHVNLSDPSEFKFINEIPIHQVVDSIIDIKLFKPLIPGFEDEFGRTWKNGDTLMIELIKNGETPVMKICIDSSFFLQLLERRSSMCEISYSEEPKGKGDLVFDVLVFDRSLCEREYVPFTNVKEEQVEIEIDIEEENVSEDSSTGKKLNTRSKPKASCSIHQQNNPKSSPAPIELQEHPAAKVAKGSGSVSGKSKASPSSAIQKRLFVANVTKWTTSVSKLYIPLKFSRLYFENRKYCKVILIDQEGRRWPTHLWNNGEQCHIADGWNEFRLANNLNPGDSFVFELIENGQKPVLKMCGVKASHRAASSSMEKPHFYLTVQISHLRTLQMKVPKKLASMSELAKSTGVIITNEKGKSWWVSTRLDKDDKVFLTSGWTELLKANGLEEGDVFMLELVKKGTTPQMKIYAFKQDMGSN